MALTQTQLDNLVTLLKSEDFEDIQNGTTLIDTLVDSGMIGKEEFIQIIEEITGGVILSDEQYAECVNLLKEISQVVLHKQLDKDDSAICSTIGNHVQKTVIHRINSTNLSCLFDGHEHQAFMVIWSFGLLSLWRNHRKSLDVSSDNLQILPESITNLTHLKRLYLSCNRLTTLPKGIGKLTKLRHLHLDQNRLTILPESIENLTRLTRLDLSHNQLTKLPKTIGNLSKVSMLDISYNPLESLPNNLVTLKIDEFQWEYFQYQICNLTTLKTLRLSSKKYVTEDFQMSGYLSDSIGNLINLSELLLCENDLSFLPESIGNLTNLTELWLWNNQLTTLPDSIENLTNLTYLDLRKNPLENLPNNLVALSLNKEQWERFQQLSTMTALKSLGLGHNQLTRLPDSIGNLTNLTTLGLSYNQLTTLPDSFGDLTNLTNLGLYNNEITSLPDSIGNLTNLTELTLWDNPISESEQERIRSLLPNCRITF